MVTDPPAAGLLPDHESSGRPHSIEVHPRRGWGAFHAHAPHSRTRPDGHRPRSSERHTPLRRQTTHQPAGIGRHHRSCRQESSAVTEHDLIEHLSDRLDEARDERLALYGLALGLLSTLDQISALVPTGTAAELEWHQSARWARLLDQAVDLLGCDDNSEGLIAGIDVAALRSKLAVFGSETGAVR